MSKTMSYTHSSVPIMSLESRKSCTGLQLAQVFFFQNTNKEAASHSILTVSVFHVPFFQMALVALPLAAFGSLFESPSYSLFVLSVVSVDWNKKNTATYGVLKSLTKELLYLMNRNGVERVTLKFHVRYSLSISL